MQLKVLASGSKGNCYLLYTDKGIVILVAGTVEGDRVSCRSGNMLSDHT